MQRVRVVLPIAQIIIEVVASIEAIGDRGQREVTCHAVPFRIP